MNRRVSVGIPAYNEAANIGRLLQNLLDQAEDGFTLTEILIASDGSTDDTAKVVRSFNDPRIKFQDSAERLGKTSRINQLLTSFTGELIVLIDADVLVKDSQFIARAIRGFDADHGLLGVKASPLPGQTFVEKCLVSGAGVVERAAATWNRGSNYLSFKGACLILSAEFAHQIKMPANLVTNDAYLFFFAQQLGFMPIYRPDVQVFFRAPTTLSDHVRQSQRFKYSGAELTSVLKDFDAHRSYHIPTGILLQAMLGEFLAHPIRLAGYIAINIYTRFLSRPEPSATWEVAGSTKSLGHNNPKAK